MANRYWVGGTASWDSTAGTKWATTSGGAGGASVPTSADDVFFDANSGSVTVSIQTSTANCANFNATGFSGTVAGSAGIVVYGDFTLSSTMVWSNATTIFFRATSGTKNITTTGRSLPCALSFGLASSTESTTWALQDALVTTNSITLTAGTFTTNNYNVTAPSLSSINSNTRTINLGSSTVTLGGSTAIDFTTSTNLTFNAGTSSIVCSNGTTGNINGGGVTFYDVSYTKTAGTVASITGSNTFNNLSIAGRTSAGIAQVSFNADQTINGTLTLSAGTNATMRTFVRSDIIGTTRTLTCAAVASLTDIDFRDITIAGAAAPVSGTRLGDCKGNSGITFDAPKTVYWRATASTSWGITSTQWAFSDGGTPDLTAFPLAQDTVIFSSTYPNSGNTSTINAAYNIGTIDMSARTSNTMTLATGTQTPAIYGDWINGTGVSVSGTSTPLTFAGRGSQTITSAGKAFTQAFGIDTPGGSVTLQDAFTTTRSTLTAITLNKGTFDTNGFNVTLSGAGSGIEMSTSTAVRVFILGSATLTIAGSSGWSAGASTNLTVTGTGTISLTSASAKTFAGGGIQTYPTLNQGGTGTLTVTGSNKFAGLTNTAIGRIQFTGGTTNEFTSFTISGALANLLPLGSTNTTQAILVKPSAWQMGTLSMDSGNNTNLSFLASDGTMEYLNVSYINGVVSTPVVSSTGNFLFFF